MMEYLTDILESWLPDADEAVNTYCKSCFGMLNTAEGLRDLCSSSGYRHHSKNECFGSAHNGCALCRIIYDKGWKAHGSKGDGSYDDKWNEPHLMEFWKMPQNLHFFCRPSEIDELDWLAKWGEKLADDRTLDGTGWLVGGVLTQRPKKRDFWFDVITFAILASPNDPAAEIFPKRPMGDAFLVDHIVDGVSEWIEECASGSHVDCVTSASPELPTRVLDVGNPGEATARLHTTRAGESGEYLTLSYSWGGPQPLTTNKANLEELSRGFEVARLPKTLQDAVVATRRLGYRHLWIDALCIVQDDNDDKAREIGKMGIIYRNSTATLAAAHSRSATSGFLAPDLSRVHTESCVMPVRLPGRRRGAVTLSTRVRNFRPDHPLLTRGWAFQEAVLSTRIVVFSEFEVYCQCGRTDVSRVYNSGSIRRRGEDRLYSPDGRTISHMRKNYRKGGERWMKAHYLAQTWEQLIGQFTLRALTDPEDRLPGVQGLASEMTRYVSEEVDGGYEFGTWMGCLPRLLLWSRNNTPTLGCLEPAHYRPKRSPRAPSWSWACLDCPVFFTATDWDRYDAIVSVSDDENRPIASSEMRVDRRTADSWTLEVQCEMLFRSREQFLEDQAAGVVRVAMDLETDEAENSQANGVHYMLMCRNIGAEDWNPDMTPAGDVLLWFVSGLVGLEIADGVFQRLGYFRWDIVKPLSDGHSFGVRKTVQLV